MSVDPRTLKSLIQAQLAPSLSFGANARKAAGQGESADSLFHTILAAQLGHGAVEGVVAGDGGLSQPLAAERLWAQVASSIGFEGKLTWSGDSGASNARSGFPEGAVPFEGIIASAAAKYGVDSALVTAVIATESGFQPLAESHAGAKGLMQLMDGTARGLGVANSFDPVQNIEGGTRYLSLLLRKYNGNEAVALAAYNAGPGRIDRLGIKTDEELRARLGELPEETQRYVGKVQDQL